MKKTAFTIILAFIFMLNVKAATVLTYNSSTTMLQNYYNNINKSDFFVHSNAGLISANEYNKTLSSDTPGSTFLYNGKAFLLKDAFILNESANIKAIGPDENTNARLSVLLNRGIKVKGSGTKADPYTFVDTSDIKIISMKKDGVDVTEVPNVGKYDFVSNCIGGSASYSNTTHELSVKITKAPVICSLEFNEIKSAKIVAYIYGANTEINEKDILLEESGSIDYTLKSGYVNQTPYMYCENGTTLTYSSTKITINNVTKDDTCHVVFPKNIAYTSEIITEKIAVTGTYKIEAWGAQGKNYSSSYQGGKGGYISGNIVLAKDTPLTIMIGKQDGTNGGGIGPSGSYNGGGSSRIINGTTTLLTAAGGGGASSRGSGGAGGSGDGAGGSSVGAGAGVLGVAGGGGSSSPNDSYCWGGGYSTYYNDCYNCGCSYTCTSFCYDNYVGENASSCADACWIGGCITCGSCSKYYSGGCSTSYGYSGHGGTSIAGTGVTNVSKTDGSNSGDGKVKITLLSR